MRMQLAVWVCVALLAPIGAVANGAEQAEGDGLRAGAAAVDVSPDHLPAIINGGFTRRTADSVADPLHARAVVLAQGETRIAIVVVDSCMLPRDLIDEAKALAADQTGIAADHILVSATHTHSAPAAMGALGCEVDPEYAPLLPPRISEAIAEAEARLEPAEVGHAVVDAPEYTAVRRWIYRPGVVHEDPFGERTVRANMHPGSQSPDATGPSGPKDSDFTLFAVRSADAGRPIALFGNYAMHYFGSGVQPVSADYFGRFARDLEQMLGHDDADAPPFVAALSNGTSGDLWWKDYFKPDYSRQVDEYARTFAEFARDAYEQMQFDRRPGLAMAEAKLTLDRRTPDEDRLAWARDVVEEVGDRPPRNRTEVYAFEQIYLHEDPTAELVLQAARIGEMGVTAIPNEVYALTGLKLKHHSPLEPTMNISLANGAEGYIPPPEQHELGGYNTWPARTAGLEEQAEPRIAETVISLLEEVAGESRQPFREPESTYASRVLSAEPRAYWRMGEFAGPTAHDTSRNNHDGRYESHVVFALPGPDQAGLASGGAVNRSPHFAGGRMRSDVGEIGDRYTVECWFWAGVDSDLYPVTGYLFSRGPDGAEGAPGDHLGIGGTHGANLQGRLFFYNGDEAGRIIEGETEIERHVWHHAALVRDGESVTLYLDGELEARGEAAVTIEADRGEVFIGGRNDGFANFPGRIDEAVIHDRALTADEIAEHYRAAVDQP